MMSAKTTSTLADMLAAQLQQELDVGTPDDLHVAGHDPNVATTTNAKQKHTRTAAAHRKSGVDAAYTTAPHPDMKQDVRLQATVAGADDSSINLSLYQTAHAHYESLSSDACSGDEARESDEARRTRKIAAERRRLVEPTDDDIRLIAASLGHKLEVNRGECIVDIGVAEEDGTSLRFDESDLNKCLQTLQMAADKLSADVTLLGDKTEDHATPQTLDSLLQVSRVAGNGGDAKADPNSVAHELSAHVVGRRSGDANNRMGFALVRRRPDKVEDKLEVRVAVVGNVDAGKSTLLGVLTKNALDNGRGKARVALFRHKHEMDTGRTSSVGMECMGFDSKGRQVGVMFNPRTDVTEVDELEKPGQPIDANGDGSAHSLTGSTHGLAAGTHAHEKKITWEEIAHQSAKMITFIDLAGHERYLKTTTFGLCGAAPDFSMLMVGSNAGIIGMTKEHLGLSLALNVPVLIVVTKVDMCPTNVLEATIRQLMKILKSPGCRKIPMFVRTSEDVVRVATSFVSERICPIFLVSNVTGEGLPYLRKFINILPMMRKYDVDSPVEYQITESFSVPGVGTVVSGVVMSGVVHQGDTLLLGPDSLGNFVPTVVKSIQRKRVNVPCASAGQSASFALKRTKRSVLRKGMVMLSKNFDPPPIACRDFEAEVLVLYHSTTINTRYQAMLHCQNVRQTVKLVDMDRTVLRTGDRALVRFTFLGHPEYLKPGSRILFREGRTKGIGKVTRVFAPGEVIPPYTRLDTTNTLAQDAAALATKAAASVKAATDSSSILMDKSKAQDTALPKKTTAPAPKTTVEQQQQSPVTTGGQGKGRRRRW